MDAWREAWERRREGLRWLADYLGSQTYLGACKRCRGQFLSVNQWVLPTARGMVCERCADEERAESHGNPDGWLPRGAPSACARCGLYEAQTRCEACGLPICQLCLADDFPDEDVCIWCGDARLRQLRFGINPAARRGFVRRLPPVRCVACDGTSEDAPIDLCSACERPVCYDCGGGRTHACYRAF